MVKLVNLTCLSSNKKKERRPKQCRKCSILDRNKSALSASASDGSNCFGNPMVEQCYINLSKVMVEDNPLDLESLKEKQDEDNDFSQSLARHPT